MTFFESKIPDFLIHKGNTTRQLIFTSIFALVFINIYSPFGLNTWFNLTRLQLFFYSSLVILSGLLIIAISRIIMYKYTRKRPLNYGNYILWIAAEIISLAAVYVLLKYFIISPPADLLTSYKDSLKTTLLVLLMPYSISYLYFSWKEKNKKLELLRSIKVPESKNFQLHIPFRDERGELRFFLKREDLLYIEGADNYIKIHYLNGKSHQIYMLRNSLKKLEKEMSERKIIRCHRSYIVNFSRVKIVRKERDGLVLEIDSPGNISLPISDTYLQEVLKAFSDASGQ